MHIVECGMIRESWFGARTTLKELMILFCSVVSRGIVSAFLRKTEARKNRCETHLGHLGRYTWHIFIFFIFF